MLKESVYYAQKATVKIVIEPHLEKLDKANYVYFRLQQDLVRFEVISEPVPPKTVVAYLLNKTLSDVSLADYNEHTGKGALSISNKKALTPGRVIDLTRASAGVHNVTPIDRKRNYGSVDPGRYDVASEKSRGFSSGIPEWPNQRTIIASSREPRLCDDPLMFMITCYSQ